jgi:hypothetical protein
LTSTVALMKASPRLPALTCVDDHQDLKIATSDRIDDRLWGNCHDALTGAAVDEFPIHAREGVDCQTFYGAE